MTTIYFLSDEFEKDIFYVGLTTLPLAKRLNNHIAKAKADSSNNTKSEKIRMYGSSVVIRELEQVDNWDSSMAELFWIEMLKSWGFVLHNIMRNNYPKEAVRREYMKSSYQRIY